MLIEQPEPLKFGKKKINSTDYLNYRSQMDNPKVLKEIIPKFNLQSILDLLGFSSGVIKQTNSFFTPKENSEKLVELSGIEYDERKRIDILEPTAGIGNIISALLKLDNSLYFHIDANENLRQYYEIGKAIYDDLKNISWFNENFFNFKTNKKYDYIFINPPFNVRINDKQVLDIDFLDYSYQLLKNGGKLCCIMSGSFLSNKQNKKYVSFKDKVMNSDNIDWEEFSGFKVDDTIVKDMAVKIKMVYVIITKIPNFTLY